MQNFACGAMEVSRPDVYLQPPFTINKVSCQHRTHTAYCYNEIYSNMVERVSDISNMRGMFWKLFVYL